MGTRHRPRAERLSAAAAFTALGLGAVGMAFERAGPSVTAATPAELAEWAARHHRALTAQSGVYLVSTAPLLVFFAGLGRSLRSPGRPVPSAVVVPAAGAAWVACQAAAQVSQVQMARAAAYRASGSPEAVTAHAGRMRDLLRYGNAALGVAAAATADASLRQGLLPRWLGALSAATAAAHVVPLAASSTAERSTRAAAAVEVLPYPFFVAWVGCVGGVLLRRARRG